MNYIKNYSITFNASSLEFQSTPSVGRATAAIVFDSSIQAFQSTPSVGRATTPRQIDMILRRISIHALRGEGDRRRLKKRTEA